MTEHYSLGDGIATFMILMTGTAEVVHLYGVSFHRSLSECTILFGILAVVSIIMLAAAGIWRRRQKKITSMKGTGDIATKLLFICFLILAALQLVYAAAGKGICRQGDMTVETVGSFLQNDALYEVNPMTGRAYEGGIPSRLKILCLPTLYASLCRMFQLTPQILVWHVIPVLTIIYCYAAYCCLAGSLFPGDRRRQLCFLVVVALLIWAGNYDIGVDGFQLLRTGWRGVTLRNCVLIPYAFSLCLRKK